MTGMTLLIDRSQAHRVSRAEFEAWVQGQDERFDHNRYELLDGEILVTPSPVPVHQRVVGRLTALLTPLAPDGHEVFPGPLDVALPSSTDTVLQPDLSVVRREDLTPQAVEGIPLLVVEVLSPSTWRRDLGPKGEAYAAGGVPHYWVVAPTAPSLTAFRLGADGTYRESAHAVGEELGRLTEPVTLEVRPADLVL